jgi:hypothetical protein
MLQTAFMNSVPNSCNSSIMPYNSCFIRLEIAFARSTFAFLLEIKHCAIGRKNLSVWMENWD